MSRRIASFFALAGCIALAGASAVGSGHVQRRSPSTSWYHADDHPAHSLFKRNFTDGTTYAPIGSQEWANAYPQDTINVTAIPKAWIDALNSAVSAGKIPNLPPSTVNSQGFTTYSGGLDPNGQEVCSATYQCYVADDLWNAPQGDVGLSFDDGPLPTSTALYEFLANNSLRSTHFFIGSNILYNPQQFSMAFDQLGDDIAVHTWTHPYMTTLSNEELVGEFGWTMEIIHNSTGGRLPKYWRPPYGDADNRVRAIAKEVFGLTTVIWNQDTGDWSLTSGGTTAQAIHNDMEKWLTGPKNPGLIILEHELSNQSVQAFMDAYPIMKSNGWNTISVAELSGGPVYQNSDNSTDPVTPGTVANLAVQPPPNSTSSTPASTSTQSTSSSAPSGSNHNTSGTVSISSSGRVNYLIASMAAIGLAFLC
ncbi:carbohydrate esterase family 4 protein [Serpula lacrymans var. lacrymans S7.3]|uniref:chitin deacetylase n=2 Tax=Serpula lacrymans var. lacrymans TaxID=341189 RepID=F8PP12_SERL3|nr:carbohydrate esterase family 4 protein [Serpula lacrymans var. lacrymans S7.9]EGO01889.1 carbohydrate esterase family 4 protein [Serpula lacrymans var. lacrymans S7.3]EGO27515.1 carbohydrate esterase family 4 protein [Serpula lacrymans var. lacrymans S7.9]